MGFETLLGDELIALSAEHVGRARLAEMGLHPAQFFQERWEEAHADPTFVSYKEARREAVRQIPEVLRLLQAKIRV
jgi:hypothetical protein